VKISDWLRVILHHDTISDRLPTVLVTYFSEKDEVKEVEIEVTEEYRRRHFKEGKFDAEGPAADALGMLAQGCLS
jgi:hypothetical protein